MCTSGCPTQDCESYAACLKGKGVRTVYAASAAGRDYTREKKWHKELDAYESARAEGLQPAGTSMKKIDAAKAIADKTGTAYDASKGLTL